MPGSNGAVPLPAAPPPLGRAGELGLAAVEADPEHPAKAAATAREHTNVRPWEASKVRGPGARAPS